MKKIIAVLLITLTVFSLVSCNFNANNNDNKDDNKDKQEVCEHVFADGVFDAENSKITFKCTKCNEEKVENMVKPTLKYLDGTAEVKTQQHYGKIELDETYQGSKTLLGWEIDGVIYKKGTYFYLFKDTEAKAVFEGSSHVHAYELNSSTAPSCTAVGEYVYKCSCKNEKKIVAPVLAHSYSEYVLSSDGKTEVRYCFACGEKQTTPIFDYAKGGNLLAIGDSLTEGKKVNGINGSYAKAVAEGMGLTYVNKSLSGSEVYQWYSLYTGKSAPNGKKTTDINGMTRNQFINQVKDAEVVIFTLGTNDVTFYVDWRTVKQVYTTLFQLIDAMKQTNPDLEVIYVGGAYGVNWLDGYPYNNTKDRMIEYNKAVLDKMKTDAYKDFCIGVDVSSVLSDSVFYQDVSYGSADYVHPGYKGNAEIARLILDQVGLAIKK